MAPAEPPLLCSPRSLRGSLRSISSREPMPSARSPPGSPRLAARSRVPRKACRCARQSRQAAPAPMATCSGLPCVSLNGPLRCRRVRLLDQMRNDMALLLSDDLAPTLQFMPIPAHQSGVGAEPAPSNFADCVVGLWAFSRELVQMLESIAAPTMPPATLRESAPTPEPPTGPLLR